MSDLNEQLLQSVYNLFGKDIIKNTYLTDEKYFSKDDVLKEDSISITNVGLVIEFINGKKIEIRGAYGWADIMKAKE